MGGSDLEHRIARIADGIAEVQSQISWIEAHVRGRNRSLRRWRPQPMPAGELDALETQVGVALPAEYRAFLTTLGTGPHDTLLQPDAVAADNRFDRSERDPWAHVRRPFSLVEGVATGPYQTVDEEVFLLDGALMIEPGGCTFYTVLAVTGELAGTVWTNTWAKPESPCEYVWVPAQPMSVAAAGSEPVTFLQWFEARLDWLRTSVAKPTATPC